MLETTDISQLVNKKIGYYTGSFDPFHNGHKEVVYQALETGKIDYIIVYPVPGQDRYKQRADWEIRKQMVHQIFKSDPRILGTHLSPKEMQDLLKPYFHQMKFVGVVGSDVIFDPMAETDETQKAKMAAVYLRGLDIPEKHANTTVGAIMALPCDSFIVSLRNGASPSTPNEMFEDRLIECYISPSEPASTISSTKIKEALRQGKEIEEMVDLSVKTIIQKNQLYTARE
jgi:cytidyltransferase-like protein